MSLRFGGNQAIRVSYLSTAESQIVTRLRSRSSTHYDQATAAGHESRCRWLSLGLEVGAAGPPCPTGARTPGRLPDVARSPCLAVVAGGTWDHTQVLGVPWAGSTWPRRWLSVDTGLAPGLPSGSPPPPCPPQRSLPLPARAGRSMVVSLATGTSWSRDSAHARFCPFSKLRAQTEARAPGTGTSAPTGHTRNGGEPQCPLPPAPSGASTGLCVSAVGATAAQAWTPTLDTTQARLAEEDRKEGDPNGCGVGMLGGAALGEGCPGTHLCSHLGA